MSKHSTRAQSSSQADDFRRLFYDFMRYEQASGGPDQHMELASRVAREVNDGAYFIGCYLAPYHVPGGCAIYAANNRFTAQSSLEHWLNEHWPGIPVARDRRPCKSKAKMAEYLTSYAQWIENVDFNSTYDELWDSLQSSVRFVGRYSSLKLLEGLRRSGVTTAAQYDIRAHGAWSPRLALSYLRPEYNELLNNDGSQRASREVEALAKEEFTRAQTEVHIPDWYTWETLLCNSRQCVDAVLYPGRALDVELQRHDTVQAHFGDFSLLTRVVELRQELWSPTYLGEVQGWRTERKPLAKITRDHGYMWSDSVYDWNATTDFANPVKKEA
jgi:hypothetical protein